MPGKHSSDNNNNAELPSVAIVVTGKNAQAFQDTSDSIESQSYENVSVIKNEEDCVAKFFNGIEKKADVYGFLNAGDILVDGAVSKVVDKIKDKNIGGIYGDISVEHDGTVQEFYFPPFSANGFSAMKGTFPFFIGKDVAMQLTLDENIKYLQGYATLLKISSALSIAHIPELLVRVVYKETDVTSDMDYLSALNK